MANATEEMIGKCSLCGPDNREKRVLRKSHLLPKATYKYFNQFKAKGTNLLLRSPEDGRIFSMGAQIVQVLLCDTCEGLMSAKGEDYFLSKALKINEKEKLPAPLYHILVKNLIPIWKQSAPHAFYGRNLILSVGTNFFPAIDSLKLYHFAIGLFWKATFTGWKHCRAIPMEPSIIEQMRKFLLGGNFVDGYIIRVVPSFWQGKYGAVLPTLIQGQPFFSIQNFDFYLGMV